jgi:hypothetical protein
MSSDESFLSRWSRRKREGEGAPAPTPAPEEPRADALPLEASASGIEPKADLSHLPPVDLIDAATDIQGFLARGVPAALTQAALRRAWAADPAIREFIGLSENAWDFTAPDGVPGFGPLTPDAVPNVTASLTNAPRVELPSPGPSADPGAPTGEKPVDHGIVKPAEPASEDVAGEGAERVAEAPPSPLAGQSPEIAADLDDERPRRRHGGAVPV